MEACNVTQVLCWYCMLNAFKTVDLILTRGIFVNLDCNLQTVEANQRQRLMSAAAQNKQHFDTRSLTLFT